MEKIDARKLPRDAQDEMRRQAMRMREELKLPWKEIARVVGVNVSTVIGWSKRYLREGTAGLKSKTRGRRYLSGRTLTLVQEWQLRSVIVGENPKQMSLPYALWNRRAVMQLVKVLFDIDMPIRTVGEYLLRWGYTPQRPIKRALEQNPVKVEQCERWPIFGPSPFPPYPLPSCVLGRQTPYVFLSKSFNPAKGLWLAGVDGSLAERVREISAASMSRECSASWQ
jgi:transposase